MLIVGRLGAINEIFIDDTKTDDRTMGFIHRLDGMGPEDVIQSILMIASFLTIPLAVAAEYGALPAIGPADCDFLRTRVLQTVLRCPESISLIIFLQV